MAEIYIYTSANEMQIFKPKFFVSATAAYDYLIDKFVMYAMAEGLYDDIVKEYGLVGEWKKTLSSKTMIMNTVPDVGRYTLLDNSFLIECPNRLLYIGEVHVLTDEETEKLETLIKVAKKMEEE